MTREEAAQLWPVMKAYSEGKEIQHYGIGGWVTISNPTFNGDTERYRIAPAKVRVKGWLNVYPDAAGNSHVRGLHASRADADREASPNRIACIAIDVEGERLG